MSAPGSKADIDRNYEIPPLSSNFDSEMMCGFHRAERTIERDGRAIPTTVFSIIATTTMKFSLRSKYVRYSSLGMACRRRGGTIFRAALPSAGPSGHANSPHPSSREGHHSTAWWSSSFLLFLISLSAHAVTSLVHLNSVPSTQMRCMITAKRRARATIARFAPRRLAICIAQALSHDHRVERSILCAAS